MNNAHPNSARSRKESGVYLLELVIALAISGMLAGALAANIADTERFSTSGQRQIVASALAQEQIDNARNMSFDDLNALSGNHTLKVNNPDLDYVGCPLDGASCKLNPRPLMLDMGGLTWSQMGQNNKFDGQVMERVEAGPLPQTLRVTVNVAWKEGTAQRSYILQTVISKNGINNN